jgi:hypothetical protein
MMKRAEVGKMCVNLILMGRRYCAFKTIASETQRHDLKIISSCYDVSIKSKQFKKKKKEDVAGENNKELQNLFHVWEMLVTMIVSKCSVFEDESLLGCCTVWSHGN